MASPFHTIRKNQKLILGILGIMLMIAFVFGDLTYWMGSGPAQSNDVVVTTNYATIKEQDMGRLLQDRAMVNRFMSDAFRAAYGGYDPSMGEAFPYSERAIVQTMVLAHKGEELGMVVSDRAVNEFIKQQTGDRVTSTELRNIMSSAKISQRRLFDCLGQVILANQMAELSLGGVEAAPPAQRWEYFQRLRRQVKAEVLPVPVEQFAAQVKAPTDNELKSFFEEFRDRYPQPGSPEPGFKVPPKGKFDFVRADYQAFYDKALAAVTAEDIQKHYDANKDSRYLYRELPDFGAGTSAAPVVTDGATSPAGEVEKSETPGTPATIPPQDTPAAPATTSPPEDAPAGDAPNASPPPASTPETSTPAAAPAPEGNAPQATPETTPPASEPAPPESSCGEESQDPASSLAEAAQPAAVSDTPAEQPTTPAATTESSPPAAAASDAATPPTTAPESAAGTTTEAAATDKTIPTDSTLATDSKPVILTPLSDEYLLPRDIKAGPNPKHQPLWRVEDEIRKELARTKATEQINAVFAELRQQLDAAAYSWSQQRFSGEKAPTTQAGPQVDFAKMAAGREGLSTGGTPLGTAQELTDSTDLGKTQVNGQTEFAAAAFENLPTFKPAESVDTDGNHYLFWKVEATDAVVPEFQTVKKDVEQSWKMIKARGMALDRAKALAEQAGKQAGKSLRETLGAQASDVVDTDSFSWLTLGSSPLMMGAPRPQLSAVEGVKDAGNEFMRTVYNLEPGQVGVAMNQPETVAYVIRPTEGSPDTLLRGQFMAATAGNYQSFASAAGVDTQQIFERWRKNLDEEAGIKWERDPDPFLRR